MSSQTFDVNTPFPQSKAPQPDKAFRVVIDSDSTTPRRHNFAASSKNEQNFESKTDTTFTPRDSKLTCFAVHCTIRND